MRTSVGGVKEGPLSIVLMPKRAEPLLCQQGGRGGGVSIGVHGPGQQVQLTTKLVFFFSLTSFCICGMNLLY
jgi:hypothetical protein